MLNYQSSKSLFKTIPTLTRTCITRYVNKIPLFKVKYNFFDKNYFLTCAVLGRNKMDLTSGSVASN